jgi:hypothetical protein
MQISDVNVAFDEYLKSHNSDRHTMREAWIAGIQWAMQDTLEALADYATACAGIEGTKTTPSDMFTRVAESLEDYYEAILKDKV